MSHMRSTTLSRRSCAIRSTNSRSDGRRTPLSGSVFDDLPASTERGRRARRIIRARLADYDAVPLSPFVGNFGEPGNREWKQYFLDDDNRTLPSTKQCPFHV